MCPCVHFLRYRLNVFLQPLPEVQSTNFLEIQKPWGKINGKSGLWFEIIAWKGLKLPNKEDFF